MTYYVYSDREDFEDWIDWEFEDYVEEELEALAQDQLGPSKGVIHGLILAATVWMAVGLAVAWVM